MNMNCCEILRIALLCYFYLESTFARNTGKIKSGKVECGNGSMFKHV